MSIVITLVVMAGILSVGATVTIVVVLLVQQGKTRKNMQKQRQEPERSIRDIIETT